MSLVYMNIVLRHTTKQSKHYSCVIGSHLKRNGVIQIQNHLDVQKVY